VAVVVEKTYVIRQKSKVTHSLVFNVVRISADKNFLLGFQST